MSGSAWIRLASILGAAAVIIGAFGAHGFTKLPTVSQLSSAEIDQSLEWLETGVRYHMYHSLAILVIGAVKVARPEAGLNAAATAFFVGIVIFSGMLYVMALTQFRLLGAIVPLGGSAFIVGWLAIGFTGLSDVKSRGQAD